MTMRAQLIIDCGRSIVSALIVTADGALVPCSREIRQTSTRHIPAGIVFERRASERSDFGWEEALEALAAAHPHQFFARARRIGLHQPWEEDLPAGALDLASPLSLLSSAAALTDPSVQPALLAVGVALLDALLDPIFAFSAARKFAPADVDVVVIISANVGRLARAALHKIVRRRGFRRLTLLTREIAATMALVETPAAGCLVWEASDHGLHLHRVAVEREGDEQRLTTTASHTLRASSWSKRDRQGLRDDSWREQQRAELAPRLRQALAQMEEDLPSIAVGEICALDDVRRLLLDAGGVEECAPASDVPVLDRLTRGAATAALWLRGSASRRIVIRASGGLRVNTLRGETVEILSSEQLPGAGESCHVGVTLPLCGATDSNTPFLLHFLWGGDRAPEGDATLCALRLDRDAARDGRDALHISVHLRRSRSGRRLDGTVHVRGAAADSRFTHEFPLLPTGREVGR